VGEAGSSKGSGPPLRGESENPVKAEVHRIFGSVTEPIQERHRSLTYLADNARKPLGEVEDPPPLAQHVGGHPLLDTNLPRSWLCPALKAQGFLRQ
jgi:hypothetical protein